MQQNLEHLDAKEVQTVGEVLSEWKEAVEQRTSKNFVLNHRKADWQRAKTPREKMRRKTWLKHVRRLVKHIQDDWNSALEEGEEPLQLTEELFLTGPPNLLMTARASADLQQLPPPTEATIAYLSAY